MLAAQAAHCADDQKQFLPMHNLLFGELSDLERNTLMNDGRLLRLDMTAFQSCLDSGNHKEDIQNDIVLGTSLQIIGTPSFLIGKIKDDEVSGAILVGAQPLSVFEAKLREVDQQQ
jgi:protein-disulfide isomerase